MNRLLTLLRRRSNAPRALLGIALLAGLGTLTFATASWARPGRTAANESVQVWLTTTSGSSLATRLAQQGNVTFGAQTGTTPTIDVDTGTTYQTMDGFGAAMTDSGAWLINGTSQRNAIMGDLFGSSGIGLNFVRLPMGASDISRNNYSYDDTCCDLNDFSVGHDTSYIIPLLQQARSLNGNLKILGTPWSAPGWMKIGGTFVGNCNGSSNYLQNALYNTYAQYFVKFVQAYQNTYGLPIWGLSMENEPHNCNSSYATMSMEPGDQSNFAISLRNALNGAGLGGVRIMAWDHNWYENNAPSGYPQAVLSYNGSQALNAIQAIGWHCYSGPTPGAQSVGTTLHNAYPSKDQYMTECTGGSWATNAASNFVWDLQNLLIEPTRNWSKGSIYWSIALDPAGNPHVGGCVGCRGMVTVNSNGTYTKNEDYYAWGHFSKFVTPGAVRIASTDLGAGNVETAAFRNPDGSLVLVALNSGTGSRTFQVRWNGQGFTYTLGGNGAATFKWTPGSGGGGGGGIDPAAWYTVANQNSNACVDDAGTANASVVQQWACSNANNQQWQFQPTDSGYYKVANRRTATQVWDVTGGSGATGDSVKIQTWAYGGGTNQQWQPVSVGTGLYKLVARHSGKCLDVPGASTANGVQLQQYTCNGTAAQTFRLAQQP